jgi:hypothetical protein
MKQSLIDKFKPEVANLSQAKELQDALEALPESVVDGEIDRFSGAYATMFPGSVARIAYHHFPSKFIPVVFPKEAENCMADGAICTFDYKGRKYRIN